MDAHPLPSESSVTRPQLSIVMSVKNGMPFLTETIESILIQTKKDWELIAINDGSDDDTGPYLQAMAQQDSRIKVLQNETSQGMGAGLNQGIEAATSDWIVRMDGDDIMMPQRLERQWAFIQTNPDVKVSCCRGRYINENGKEFGKTAGNLFTREKFQWYVDQNEAIGLLHPGVIMHRETVRQIGGYRKAFWPAEDIDLWNRLAEKGHLILIQDDVLIKYRLHSSSAITSGFKKGRLKYEWVRACMNARRLGQKEPSWDVFIDQLNRAPWWRRLNHWRKTNAKAFYREAGQNKLAGRLLPFMLKASLACFLQPGYVFNRVREQVIG